MPHLDKKERDRLRSLPEAEKQAETSAAIHAIHVAVHAGTLDRAAVDEALERLTEMHVKPDAQDRLGGPDKDWHEEKSEARQPEQPQPNPAVFAPVSSQPANQPA